LTLDEAEAVMPCARFAAEKIIEGMRADLVDFGMTFDRWFSEQSLYDATARWRRISATSRIKD
jgi:arginyl-tRNA synthetase